MILDHNDDGTLVDGQVDVTKPIPLLAERIEEAKGPPNPCPMPESYGKVSNARRPDRVTKPRLDPP
jgi:hypothetical protein